MVVCLNSECLLRWTKKTQVELEAAVAVASKFHLILASISVFELQRVVEQSLVLPFESV